MLQTDIKSEALQSRTAASAGTEEATRLLGQFVTDLRYDDLPHAVRERAKLAVLDWAGSALAGRSRTVAVLSGAALLAGSACTRFGVFEAGQESAKDPKYTVVPQRERVERGEAVRFEGS